jgi:ribosomal protein S18 acetylase RimI-like enzyme
MDELTEIPRDADSAIALRIRVATAADRVRLIPLINAAFVVEHFIEGTRTDEARLAAMMQKGEILMGEDHEGRLLCSVYIEPRSKRGYLGMIAVDPAHQGKGLARQLAQAAEDRLRSFGCEAVDLTVLSLRPELPPVYRRLGYVETGTEPFRDAHRVKPGYECHCIVMSKKL